MVEERISHTATLRKKSQKLTRVLCFVAGMVCLVLGAIGVVLPVLPTTPFLLAAAACFCKSSSRMHRWLLNNKWFGEYIRNYKEGRGLSLKTKATALTVLWLTICISSVFILGFLLPESLVFPIQLVMIAVAIAVSVHILRLPTYKKA